ncbi:hypothetical protein [Gloeocapsopsis sp. IPPAS B-1203]|nr:hypothetical protein [Gloeocapsopsis sp. IPPAS B-1203]
MRTLIIRIVKRRAIALCKAKVDALEDSSHSTFRAIAYELQPY